MTALSDTADSRVTQSLPISLREARLVVERLLVVAGAPLGAIPAIRDFIIEAECMGLPAFARLRADFENIKKDPPLGGLGHVECSPAVSVVDAAGRSGLLIGPDVADLAVGQVSRRGVSVVSVTAVRDPQFLEAVCACGPRYGVSLCVFTEVRAARMALTAGESWADAIDVRPAAGDRPGLAEHGAAGNCLVVCADIRRPAATPHPAGRGGYPVLGPYLSAAVEEGFAVEEDLWLWLYSESGKALTPDSPLSRRHTGASVLDDSGNILGEVGEDWEEQQAG